MNAFPSDGHYRSREYLNWVCIWKSYTLEKRIFIEMHLTTKELRVRFADEEQEVPKPYPKEILHVMAMHRLGLDYD